MSFILYGTHTSCIPLLPGSAMHSLLLPGGVLLLLASAGLFMASAVIHRIIAGTAAVLGGVVAWFAARVVFDPLPMTTTAINRVAGHFTGWLEVATTATTLWPMVTLIAGVLTMIFGVSLVLRPKNVPLAPSASNLCQATGPAGS